VKLLIKVGGTLLDAPESRERLAREIAAVAGREQVVVVHGGGKQMTRFLAERGIESRFVNGLRVSTAEVIDAVVKVFAGSVNAQLVTAFRKAGANPVGLSGLSGKLVDAVQLDPELGYVGQPEACDGGLLDLLVRAAYLPVVACVAGNKNGAIFNVNGDQMAAACAQGFGADRLIFLTDVEGVRDASGQVYGQITVEQALKLISSGVATGGMQAKIDAAITALEHGVGEVQIASGIQRGILDQLQGNCRVGTSLIHG
jgi:acetylglutamate kinase